MKIIVLALVALIFVSLASGLYYLIKDQGTSERTVKALTWRVALSVALFVLLMAGYYFGFIPKTGL
ncbi:MAG TPA: twin transmembrane helix small protein [Burkholderiales bacterium]|nr:twin transmembrane helix small protein [Burkholderiales bacterium]